MKKLFLLKVLGEIGIKQALLTQNVSWGWISQSFSTKMLDGYVIEKGS